MFASSATELNYKVLSLCCPLRSFNLLEGAFKQTIYLPPAHRWGSSWTILYGYLTLSPGQDHFGVVLVPVRITHALPGLWYLFEWAVTKGMLGESSGECGGRIYDISKVCAIQLKEGTAASRENSSLCLDPREPFHGRMPGWGMLLTS